MANFLKNKKYYLLGIIILLVIGFFFFKNRQSANSKEVESFSPKKDEIVKPEIRDLTQNIVLAGKIDAESKSEVRFQTSGRLAWVGVKTGDHVKKWQTIASLDKTELKKSLAKEFNDYKSQLSTFQDSQDEYKSPKESLTLTDEMRRILDRSQNGLNNSVISYELADLAIKYANIWSPINGIVVNVEQPNPGINITPATAGIYIIDPESLYFRSEIDEEDVTKISLGQATQIKIDSYPDSLVDSEISYISFSPISGQSSTVYEVRFKLDLDNQDLKYRLGMNGDATIKLKQDSSALSLPVTAVNQDVDGKSFVYQKDNNNVLVKKFVTTGIETDDYIQITDGLTSNDQVIIRK
ncbi:MAG TPA: efflux RND transporter periplasmic adaptor subunit [Candidatus Woesebacteria bacterium]|nr:efflux RND transporter periplasmic adaptor subunit [Candidatus Woesebacteria bacterium]HPJ17164.1 efflux RND transporter periplasmic adaptor subunit [Candidatus Woesebacteria bacterium]